MAANPVEIMTVEQFRNLPEQEGEFSYELHHGCLVKMTRPKQRLYSIQRKLRILFESFPSRDMVVDIELAFRRLPEYELWAADVAVLSSKRWRAIDREDNLAGAPELVIEVLSPSNSASKMLAKQELCPANGCLEFWTVDPKRQKVQVVSLDQTIAIYGPGDQIPVPLLGEGASIPVDKIFI